MFYNLSKTADLPARGVKFNYPKGFLKNNKNILLLVN